MPIKSKNKELIKLVKGTKLKDAGVKHKDLYGPMECGKSMDKNISYPTLYLSSKNAPDLVGYEVGDEVTIIIKAVITGHNINENTKNKRENFDLTIKKMSAIDSKMKKDAY